MTVTRNLIWIGNPSTLASMDDATLENVLTMLRQAAFTDLAFPIWGQFSATGELSVNSVSVNAFPRVAAFAKSAGFRDVFSYKYTGTLGSNDLYELTPSMRATMISEIEEKIIPLEGSTGYIDDLEMEYPRGGKESDYVAYVNDLRTMCYSHGKIGGCYLMVATYPYQTTRLPLIVPNLNVDFAVFGSLNPEYIDIMSSIGSCDWFPHLLAANSAGSMVNSTSVWDSVISRYSGLPGGAVGFGVWCYEHLRDLPSELDVWLGWEPKDLYVEPIPPEPPVVETFTVSLLPTEGLGVVQYRYIDADNVMQTVNNPTSLVTVTALAHTLLDCNASSANGYTFKGWNVDGTISATELAASFSVSKNLSVKAVFSAPILGALLGVAMIYAVVEGSKK